MCFPRFVRSLICVFTVLPLFAQSPNGNINGLVSDPASGIIAGAEVVAVNDATGAQYITKTNSDGIYVLPSLPPGPYRLQVSKIGFKTIIKPDIVLNVQDALSLNFTLPVGALYEIVTVEGGAPLVNTENASVSTVIDRQFAENLPMNGRSFQTLIDLTPGVVLTSPNVDDSGQFSVNGQRTNANYWMVDGVSASIGAGGGASGFGDGFAGSAPALSVQGGTNSLVSVDALQEFRIQTSTYAPEFGRTPGGQISIVTRSGSNLFHGTAFDYLRNDVLDSNNWFSDAIIPPLPKAKDRQNDFGGTFSGPIFKDRTFFFFSYEGLRLRLPTFVSSVVPSVSARQSANAEIRPLFNAFPLPNGSDLGNGNAQFNANFSNVSSLDATSLRIDHRPNDKLTLFGRYNYSPSDLVSRQQSFFSLANLTHTENKLQTGTAGITWNISNDSLNDFRFNYSRSSSGITYDFNDFGGAEPPPSSTIALPSPYNLTNSAFGVAIFSTAAWFDGNLGFFSQRQFNLVDDLSLQKQAHSLKFGVDYRQLLPTWNPPQYREYLNFLDIASAESGQLYDSVIYSTRQVSLRLQNLGLFAQDTWRANPKLTITYGLRWDLDFSPDSDPGFVTLQNFDPHDISGIGIAPSGTPPYRTEYSNVAPRIGAAYQLFQRRNRETVLRAGFGVFSDLISQQVGNLLSFAQYPFGSAALTVGGTYPLSSQQLAPPPISTGNIPIYGLSGAFDPNLTVPYALEWNIAMEQSLGINQSVSASYVGSSGRNMLQTAIINAPNPAIASLQVVTNAGTSNFNSLQLRYQRRLSHSFQAISSYAFSHSIDDASAASSGMQSNVLLLGSSPNVNRGPSDFDIRHSFSAGLTYDIPSPGVHGLVRTFGEGWSTENFIVSRSAPPVDVDYNYLYSIGNTSVAVRPDLVLGKALYLFGPQYPGGKAFNMAAFTPPPLNPATLEPARQGDLRRNTLRGFGASQWDSAIHRNFSLGESLKLQFRAEIFNILNHPNFGPPIGDLTNPQFGQSTQMLGQYLSGGGSGGSGGLSSLYQIGGPRSIQVALKIVF